MVEVGDVEIEFLGHSGFLIKYKGKKIIIDPYNVSQSVKDVDIILITHNHYDHCSIKDIVNVSKKGALVITPADAQSKITRVENVEMQIIEVGDELEMRDIRIESVPAYNIDKTFHPKKEGWMGYVIKMGNTIVYHAGDTDKIPEMNHLTGYGNHKNAFVVLLPVSGKYVMNVDEAVDAADLLKPVLAIPMHYGGGVVGTDNDAEDFVKGCKEKGINAQVLKKV